MVKLFLIQFLISDCFEHTCPLFFSRWYTLTARGFSISSVYLQLYGGSRDRAKNECDKIVLNHGNNAYNTLYSDLSKGRHGQTNKTPWDIDHQTLLCKNAVEWSVTWLLAKRNVTPRAYWLFLGHVIKTNSYVTLLVQEHFFFEKLGCERLISRRWTSRFSRKKIVSLACQYCRERQTTAKLK